jgi:Calx-beta domain/Fibronectin type III domain
MAARLLIKYTLLVLLSVWLAACSVSKQIQGSIGDSAATVTLSPLTITEGQTGQAVVTLSEPQASAVVVNYSTANATAIAGTNYTSASGSLTIPAGQTSASIILTTIDDDTYTGNLNFNLDLSTAATGVEVSGSSGVVIDNINPKPTVQFSLAATNGPDSTTPHLINVTLSTASAFTTMVNYAITGGTAVGGVDYTLSPGVLTFAPGVTSQNISVAIIDTHLYQPDKTIDLDLTTPVEATLGTQTTHVHTINETTAEPTLSINNVTANAGTTANFVVTLSAASAVATTFSYATGGGTAVAGTDYTSSTGSATIAAGQTTFTLPVTTALSSGGKNFSMTLSSIVNATGATTTGTATMIVMPAISVGNVSANAGTNVNFVVTLSQASTQNITFSYATANGTAIQPTDYASSSGTATITAGQTTLTLPAITTQLSSGGKAFTLTLSSIVNAVAGTLTGTATMIVMPTINVGNTSATPGSNANVVVSLSQASSQNITFNYATANGTATQPADYTSASGSATIMAGQTSTTLPGIATLVAGNGDNFTLAISSIVNAIAGTTTGTITITSTPTINIGNVTANAGTPANFVLTLSQVSASNVIFSYATANGTAVGGTDYTSSSSTATIAAGQTTLTLPVTTALSSGGKNFTMTLSSITNALSGTLTGTATMIVMPVINISNVTVDSGSAANFVVTLAQASPQNVTFNYATANGTAVNPTNYTTSSGSATLAAGQTTLTLPVTTIVGSDGLNFTMAISSIVNATAGTTTGTATLDATISIGNVTTNAGSPANFVVTASAASASNVTFTYATADGTATQPADYTTATGTGTILAGQTTATIPVTTLTAGAALNFTMTISAPTGATLGTPTTGTATMNPVLNIGNVTVAAGTPAAFVVTLGSAESQNVTFSYATADGTAVNGTNYTGISGSATILAGATTLTLPNVTTNSSAGGIYFTMTLSSIVNATSGTTTGTATLTLSAPTQIFRSVGPSNTTALASGSSNAMTISGTTATFASGLPNNVGVGDAIVYASSGQIAFISGRTSSTQYAVRSATGTNPTAASGDTTWSIYRAYTSLAAAIAGSGQENSAIPAGLQNFDTFSNNNNLVTGNFIWNVACYDDGVDTTSVDTTGWTTSATNYLRIYTPYLATDVGASQRHAGSWSSPGYTLSVNALANFGINIVVAGIKIEGLKITSIGTTSIVSTDYANIGIAGTLGITIDDNLIVAAGVNLSQEVGIGSNGSNMTGNVYIYNNVLNCSGASCHAAGVTNFGTLGANIYAYSNTFYGGGAAFISNNTANTFTMKNNIAQHCAGGSCYLTFGASANGGDYNLSSDTSGNNAGGTHYVNSATVLFVNPSQFDFRLSPADASAKGAGTNLSADPFLAFTTDVANNTRTTPWDIGASMASAQAMPIYRSLGPTNTTALVNGGSNALTISASGVATFGSALPNNVGVGDALQYASSGSTINSIAFIYSRVSSTQYEVRTATGTTPVTATAEQTWNIFRAYTSFNNAFGSTVGTANTSILGSLVPFDTATTRNLVTTNTQMNFALYADAIESDPTGVTLSGFTTSAANTIRIYTPYASTDVGISQRHIGAWTNSAFQYVVSNSSGSALGWGNKYVWVDGLQINISTTTTGTSYGLIQTGGTASSSYSNNIIQMNNTATSNNSLGIGMQNNSMAWNNIIYVPTAYQGNSGIATTGSGTSIIYSNTVYNFDNPFNCSGEACLAKNNISQASGNWGSSSAFATGSDYNVSNTGIAAGGPHDITNAEVLFNNLGANDFRLSPADVVAKGAGENLSGDPFLAFSTDIQGLTRTTPWDIGASEVAGGSGGPMPIYRSVGPNNTTALANGTGNNLTISTGGLATFSVALPNNIGVGDALQFATTGTTINAIAFIYQRISSTQYIIRTANGGVPAARSSFTAWNIFRAYTSLANAASGHGNENTGISSNVRGFETFTNGNNNITTNNLQWNIACYADAQDVELSVFQAIDTWTTSPANYLRIYTPYLASDVGVSQRHQGVWSGSGYTLITSGVDIASGGIWIDGLQVYFFNPTGGGSAFGAYTTTGAARNYRVSKNIIHTYSPNGNGTAIYIQDASGAATTYEIWNNIVYDDTNVNSTGINVGGTSTVSYIYNNTVYNFETGISTSGSTNLLKNNIIQKAVPGNAIISGGSIAGSNYNLTNDSTSTGGASDIKNATVQFMDAPNNNYLLAPVDLVAKGAGTNLSADPNLSFTTDIAGNTRATTWDIGASMASAQPTPVYRSVGPSNTTALANGSAGSTLTIGMNGVATFTAAIPNNVGVGDALQYASSGSTINSIAFIYQRVSSTQYLVRTATGAAPTTATAEQTWNIYRAYTKMCAAISNGGGGSCSSGHNHENSGLNAAVKDFDSSWSNGVNLVSTNQQWNVAAYGDAVDTLTATIATWTTSATNYLRVYTPWAASEVGLSQRHNGVWGSGYQIVANASYSTLDDTVGNVWFDGLQVELDNNPSITYSSAIMLGAAAGAYDKVSNNIVRSLTGAGFGFSGIGGPWTVQNSNLYVWNNIVYGFNVQNGQGSWAPACIFVAVGNLYAYNNTVYNCVNGIFDDAFPVTSGIMVLKNNIVQASVVGIASDVSNISGDYNITPDGTSAGGAHDIKNATVQFLNPANNDYRLAPNDHTAHGAGELLIGDTNLAFYTDIKGKIRYSPWDIGADQALSYASNDILINNLSLSNITNTTFTVTVNYSGDEDLNGTVTFYYCDATTTPGCTATAGSSVAMTRALASHTFVANISGLTAGHAVNYSAVAADVDGVYGSPISGSLNNGPTINITASTTVNEGSSASLVVSLSATSTVATTFSYATADGTAVNGTNYTSASGTATIVAGQTTVTLPNITTINTGAGPATYFTVTLSNLVGANAGTIVSTVNLFNLTNGMTVSALTTSGVSSSSFNAQISFAGDVAAVGVATLYYCDATQVPGCSPLYGPPIAMSRGSGVFTASISGLASPISAGDTLNLAGVAFDTGGIMGSPLTSTVTLLSNNSLMLGSLATAVNSAGFSATATFTGDNNSNSSAMIFYCDNTASPGCVATSGSSTSMTRGTGVYTASVSSLTSTHQYSLAVVGTDTDGVYNSPLSGSVTLTGTPNPVAGLQAVAMSNSEIDLSWNSGGGTTVAYKIAFQAGATAPATCSGGVTTTNTSYAVTGLTTSSQYSFIVCALDSAATPASSSGVTATATTLGAAPSRVFVTSTTYTPNTAPLNSLANADSACAARAAAATGGALTGTWQAILSISTTSALSRLSINYGTANGTTGVRLIDGSPGGFSGSVVAANQATLFGGTLANKINKEETGSTTNSTTWTGTSANGSTDSGATCSDWTSTSGNGAEGSANSTTLDIFDTTAACTSAKHIYCIDTNPQYHNPPNPTNLTATAGNTNVNLAWASGGGATNNFEIAYQSGATAPSNCQSGTLISSTTVGSATTFNITGLTAGTQYGFRVCATDNSTVAVVSPGTTVLATTAAPTINIANTAAMKNSSARFVVSLTGVASSNVVFNYATADGTAVGGTDYTSTSGSATILAGQTTVTLPSVAISNTAASNAKYFTMTISSITGGANLGTLVGVGTIVDPTNGLQISSFITSNITQSSFAGQIALAAGTSVNAQITLYDCDNTVTSGCNPLDYPGTAMSIGAGAATATISGLSSPGDTYNVVVTASSPGGVIGSPLSTTVTLLSNNALTVSALRVSPSSSTAFTATINFLGDANMNSVATLFYCDDSQSSGCNPTSGSSVVMTRGAGIYTASASGLNAGDTYRVAVVATDTDGVSGSPLSTVIVLPSGSASQLVVTRPPYNPMAAGSEIPLQITIEDQNGDVVTSGPDATATITLTRTAGTQTLGGTLSMAAVNGVADFIGQKVNIEGSDTGDVITATKSDTSGTSGGTTTMTVATSPFNVTGNFSWFGSTATAQWMTTTGIPAAGSGDGMFNSPYGTFVDSSGNLYVTDLSNGRVIKYNSSGVYQGWVGFVGETPTGGAAGCTTTTFNNITPGWCLGGYGALDGLSSGIWGDGTYIYVTYEDDIFRFNASTGAYMGWIGGYSGNAGVLSNTYTSGCSTLNGSSTAVVTPGWCVGGEFDGAFVSTNGGVNEGEAITGDGTYLYVVNSETDNIQRFVAATGAPAGWIGNLGNIGGGTCGSTTGAFVGAWCSDATATSQGSNLADGSMSQGPGGIYYDSSTQNLFMADYTNAKINQYVASSGAFVGWAGMVQATPTGNAPGTSGCTTTASGNPTPGWCTGGKAQGGPSINQLKFPNSITGDGTYLYLLDGSYRVVRYQMSNGAFMGWTGGIAVAGSGSCGPIDSFTGSWCMAASSQALQGHGNGMLSVALEIGGNGNTAPTGTVFYSAVTNSLWVADSGNNRVSQYSTSGGFIGWTGASATASVGWQTANTFGAGAIDDNSFQQYVSGLFTDGLNLFVMDTNRVKKYDVSNIAGPAYVGWVGAVDTPPTGGAAGCTTTTLDNITPGWCVGGSPLSSLVGLPMGGLNAGAPAVGTIGTTNLTADGTYVYVAYRSGVTRYVEATGAFAGWIGEVDVTPTGGAAGCTTTTAGSITPGWCLGGQPQGDTISGAYNFVNALYADGTYLYIVDTDGSSGGGNGRIDKVVASTGAFVGWIGTIATSPTGGAAGCAGAAVGTITPGWCTGGKANTSGSGSDNGDGTIENATNITGDGTYIYVAVSNTVKKINASTGTFVGWIGELATTGGTCTGAIHNFNGGWCVGGTSNGNGSAGNGALNFDGISDGIYTDGLYLYATNNSSYMTKYVLSTGAFVGWKGTIGSSPTGGDTGCSGAAVGTFTPGWCTGGRSQQDAGDTPLGFSGLVGPGPITGAGTYLYITEPGNYRIDRIGK